MKKLKKGRRGEEGEDPGPLIRCRCYVVEREGGVNEKEVTVFSIVEHTLGWLLLIQPSFQKKKKKTKKWWVLYYPFPQGYGEARNKSTTVPVVRAEVDVDAPEAEDPQPPTKKRKTDDKGPKNTSKETPRT